VAPISSSKASLRTLLRAQRRALGKAQHSQRSKRAAGAIIRDFRFKAGARIAVYFPFDGETGTAALMIAAGRRGIRTYVPVVTDLRHRRLRFLPLSGRTHAGAFGISIPHRGGRWIAPRWFDQIVVPLVGVDGDGRRLGMGGGFYDRALAFRRTRRHWRGPRLIGLGFDCQRTATVFAEPWDLRLDSLATESGMQFFCAAPR
jgi:5-formyltetrahydrofolate cyclo-ligase